MEDRDILLREIAAQMRDENSPLRELCLCMYGGLSPSDWNELAECLVITFSCVPTQEKGGCRECNR